jgi:hypothetical protein
MLTFLIPTAPLSAYLDDAVDHQEGAAMRDHRSPDDIGLHAHIRGRRQLRSLPLPPLLALLLPP